MIATLIALTLAGTPGVCPNADGSWLATIPLPAMPTFISAPEATGEWQTVPVTEGGFVAYAAVPTAADRVAIVVTYAEGGEPQVEVALPPPGCGPQAAPAPVAPPADTGTAPGTVAAVVPTGEPSASTTTTTVAAAGRERSGAGGIVFILLCAVVAIAGMIVRALIKDAKRGMGGVVTPQPVAPPQPVGPPPAPSTATTTGSWWSTKQVPVADTGRQVMTPTVTTPTDPPTVLDPDDPAVDRYADEVDEWLRNQ